MVYGLSTVSTMSMVFWKSYIEPHSPPLPYMASDTIGGGCAVKGAVR